MSNWLKNCIDQLLENLKKEEYIHHSKKIFGVWNNKFKDLADIQLISKFNKGIRVLLCAVDLSSKYSCVIPLKDKKGVAVVNAFQKILDDSKRKPNKIWVDEGSEFYNSSFKKWIKVNDIEAYSTHNEGKSVFVERFIRTFKSRIYKYMTLVSKKCVYW